MNLELAQQAMDLHNRLHLALLDEQDKRDKYGHLTGDPKRLARLERLVRKAADRWRKRMGYRTYYDNL